MYINSYSHILGFEVRIACVQELPSFTFASERYTFKVTKDISGSKVRVVGFVLLRRKP
jgi:hypothetical protein